MIARYSKRKRNYELLSPINNIHIYIVKKIKVTYICIKKLFIIIILLNRISYTHTRICLFKGKQIFSALRMFFLYSYLSQRDYFKILPYYFVNRI